MASITTLSQVECAENVYPFQKLNRIDSCICRGANELGAKKSCRLLIISRIISAASTLCVYLMNCTTVREKFVVGYY